MVETVLKHCNKIYHVVHAVSVSASFLERWLKYCLFAYSNSGLGASGSSLISPFGSDGKMRLSQLRKLGSSEMVNHCQNQTRH